MRSTDSITSSPSFHARLLNAERARLRLTAMVFAAVFVSWLVRRALGAVVASDNSVYYPILAVLAAGGVYVFFSLRAVRTLIDRGRSLSWTRLVFGAAAELAVAFAILLVLHLRSPLGAHAALKAPALLMLPIVIFLSVLRLKPVFSLALGVVCTLGHWALAISARARENIDPAEFPRLFTYGLLLALAGVCAAFLARIIRSYITEAVAEAAQAEHATMSLRAVEHELNIAREVQQGLLPSQPPSLPGFDIAGMSRPAAQTGGDYYDWQTLPDGRCIVAIADVTGHGIGPAIVMAVCRAYARATGPSTSSAADFLDRINRLVTQDLTGGRFITMAVVIASPDGSIELLSAGHGPTFLKRANSTTVQHFGGDGLPLGIADAETYSPIQQLRLQPGDSLVLLTDGFMERQNPANVLFGIERLEATIARHAALPAQQLVEALDEAVARFAGSAPQNDDMTAVVLKRI